MGCDLLPRRKPGPQQWRPHSRWSCVGGCHRTKDAKSQAQHQAVPGCCPGAQAGDSGGVLVVGHAAGALAGKGAAEEVSSCTLSGRVSKRWTGSLQRLNSPKVPSKWNYSMKL